MKSPDFFRPISFSITTVITLSCPAFSQLTGIQWTLLSIHTKDSVITMQSTRPTIKFTAPDKVNAYGGCNTCGGSYTVASAGDSMSVRLGACTLLACPDQLITKQETFFFSRLSAASSYSITGRDCFIVSKSLGDTLILHDNASAIFRGISFGPNPAQAAVRNNPRIRIAGGSLVVSFSDNSAQVRVRLLDANGRVLQTFPFTGNREAVQLQSRAAGIVFIDILDDGNRYFKKVIVER